MLADFYQKTNPAITFELFPPKTKAGNAALLRHVEALLRFDPAFFTCTYGAGGSTRNKTLDIVQQVKERFSLPVASHLTCVGATVDYLREYLTESRERGVDFIVALRGDPPQGETTFTPVAGGLRYANELVSLIRGEFPEFGIAVAGYPEVHQEAPSPEVDLDNLKRKVDAGADVVVTQLFYQNEDFFRFRQRYDAAGIRAPLIPGILPVTNLGQIQRISSLCGATLPKEFISQLADDDDADHQMQIGVAQATEQVRELMQADVPGIHFYVLNKSKATSCVLNNLIPAT